MPGTLLSLLYWRQYYRHNSDQGRCSPCPWQAHSLVTDLAKQLHNAWSVLCRGRDAPMGARGRVLPGPDDHLLHSGDGWDYAQDEPKY